MDGFVDRLHALRFLRACDPSYGALTFTLVGLPPTGYISLLLDILFGSFLPSLWSSSNQSVLRSREPTLLCNHVEWLDADVRSLQSALDQTPEILQPVCVHLPVNVFLRMVDNLVREILLFQSLIRQ